MCKSLEKNTRYSIIEYATMWERYFGQMLKKSLGFILGDDGTMKIIKRNGTEAVFDIAKIRMAIQKANGEAVSSERLTTEQIDKIAKNIETACLGMNRAPGVEEIQDMVGKYNERTGFFCCQKIYNLQIPESSYKKSKLNRR